MKILKRLQVQAAPKEKVGSFKVKLPEMEFSVVKRGDDYSLTVDSDFSVLEKQIQKKCIDEISKILKKLSVWDKVDPTIRYGGHLGSSRGLAIPYDSSIWLTED